MPVARAKLAFRPSRLHSDRSVQESGRPRSQVLRSLGTDGPVDSSPEALPVAPRRKPPRQIKPQKPKKVGPRSPLDQAQAQAQPRQVLNSPRPGKRVLAARTPTRSIKLSSFNPTA